ncbi:MAG: hypothetical protein ABEL04_13760 [Salinibacter sp.]|uniref:hypothetical protein n=1 Tax=Salinibacter sp. TaxID=2065818 RepID=UPI0035D4ED10
MTGPVDHTEQICQLAARAEKLEQRVRRLEAEKKRLLEEQKELKTEIQDLKARRTKPCEEQAEQGSNGQAVSAREQDGE